MSHHIQASRQILVVGDIFVCACIEKARLFTVKHLQGKY